MAAARNIDILDRITRVLEGQNRGMSEFQRMSPPGFEGGFNPNGAQRWVQEMEKRFETLGCTDVQKATYAVFMLSGEAETWWKHARQVLGLEAGAVTWTVFKKSFLEKYFPEDIRNKKELEFMNLTQGSMNVGEYYAKFEELI